eukprot:COSAG02_NODE_3332_length_6919_cov_3.232551_2_plen_163_part_00
MTAPEQLITRSDRAPFSRFAQRLCATRRSSCSCSTCLRIAASGSATHRPRAPCAITTTSLAGCSRLACEDAPGQNAGNVIQLAPAVCPRCHLCTVQAAGLHSSAYKRRDACAITRATVGCDCEVAASVSRHKNKSTKPQHMSGAERSSGQRPHSGRIRVQRE